MTVNDMRGRAASRLRCARYATVVFIIVIGSCASAPRPHAPASGAGRGPHVRHYALNRDIPSSALLMLERPTLQSPVRGHVREAFEPLYPNLAACWLRPGGIARAHITVSGSTGRVISVALIGDDIPAPTARCLIRIFAGVQFPRFLNPTFFFSYPLRRHQN
jgi:hypothetical protein